MFTAKAVFNEGKETIAEVEVQGEDPSRTQQRLRRTIRNLGTTIRQGAKVKNEDSLTVTFDLGQLENGEEVKEALMAQDADEEAEDEEGEAEDEEGEDEEEGEDDSGEEPW